MFASIISLYILFTSLNVKHKGMKKYISTEASSKDGVLKFNWIWITEHMLFYSSEKYPEEDSYSKYLTEVRFAYCSQCGLGAPISLGATHAIHTNTHDWEKIPKPGVAKGWFGVASRFCTHLFRYHVRLARGTERQLWGCSVDALRDGHGMAAWRPLKCLHSGRAYKFSFWCERRLPWWSSS